ncbi:DNA-damage-repair/toleration protein DRT111-chloroplastic [Striga hermonthica]|uniref:DNA-damage-repair/toleration protein DRT111-chloroplastic n=1 Tax=Striga hermonthica TaxID=68872 RepID=A0A9N7RD35_STRHE|nr:DNA-damage-repair/toleration protein DRT111-chloroplastic [Striga hermonthica]
MVGGLYGDLPPPSSAAEDGGATTSATNIWSSSVKMVPPTLRKPQPPQTILRPPHTKPKQSQPKLTTTAPQNADENTNPNPSTASFQPALVGVTSSVVDEYDPARPNDYEDYRRERKRKQAEAERMMAKMGWKQGQGLGKQEQGITAPLVAKKTDKRGGVIVNAGESNKKVKSVSFNGTPTRVVLLRNMVGPGEVDDDLEGEVAEECTKFGTVTRVLIFEITEPNFPHDEAVRIFIQFERAEQATKALIELEGRFFGGRIVRACFYDEERFNNNELAPLPGEVPGFF